MSGPARPPGDSRRPLGPTRLLLGAAHRRPGDGRRGILTVVTLVALATVPTLALIVVGVASLEHPPGVRSPFSASGPDRPVVVGPDLGGPRRVEMPRLELQPRLPPPLPMAVSGAGAGPGDAPGPGPGTGPGDGPGRPPCPERPRRAPSPPPKAPPPVAPPPDSTSGGGAGAPVRVPTIPPAGGTAPGPGTGSGGSGGQGGSGDQGGATGGIEVGGVGLRIA